MTPAAALAASPLAVALRGSGVLHAAVASVHLAGMALLVGTIAAFDLRLLGLSRALPVRRLAAHLLPWTAASLLLIVPSGLLMFLSRAQELIGSPLFALKMTLIFVAAINAVAFHAGVFRGVAGWDVDAPPPWPARAAAAASLLIWISVIVCGRLLAKA